MKESSLGILEVCDIRRWEEGVRNMSDSVQERYILSVRGCEARIRLTGWPSLVDVATLRVSGQGLKVSTGNDARVMPRGAGCHFFPPKIYTCQNYVKIRSAGPGHIFFLHSVEANI
jgi:hypothetical protein